MRRTLLAALLLAGCARPETTASDVEVVRGFAFAPATTPTMAAYFTALNHGTAPDTLVAISADQASMAMIHRQSAVSGGMMHMEAAGALAIPPGDSLVLAPGGLHVMLELRDSTLPQPGDTVALTAHFARAGDVRVMLPVRAYGDAP